MTFLSHPGYIIPLTSSQSVNDCLEARQSGYTLEPIKFLPSAEQKSLGLSTEMGKNHLLIGSNHVFPGCLVKDINIKA